MFRKKIFSLNYLLLRIQLASFFFRQQIEHTLLGVLWYFLNPLITFFVLYMVFSHTLGSDIPDYSAYVLTGVVLWNVFSRSTLSAASSISNYSAIIQKIPVDKSLIVEGSVISSFISFLADFIILLLFLLILGFFPSFNCLCFLLLLLSYLMFVLGLSYYLSALFSRVPDFANVWRLLLFLGWFLTPVFYAESSLKGSHFFRLVLWNPLTWVFRLFRNLVLYNSCNLIVTLKLFVLFFVFALLSKTLFSFLIAGVEEKL